ncbi:MAG: protein phosphatase 2C domain-containing protein [Planctomycetia bacterium]|nr:protein phosphatase 2C domain-containing protein [Planctomycetia bacterium]
MSLGSSVFNYWWSRSLEHSSRSDVGMRRTNNQDSHRSIPATTLRLWRTRGHLFVVADGMGAHAAGELASQMAVETISQSYLKKTDLPPEKALREAFVNAHEKIKKQGKDEEAFHDMGTTSDALVLLPEGALVAHVGDSRVYRLRGNVYEQLTFDHSLLWELKRSGKITDKVPDYIPKNVITRSLGPTEKFDVDLEGPFPLQKGDTFLLCSDGLSGQINDDEMGQILSLFPPEEATETMINLANLRGGPDNITVVVAKMVDIPDPDEVRKSKRSERVYEKQPFFTIPSLVCLALANASLLTSLLFFLMKHDKSNLHSLISLVVSAGLFGIFFYLARRYFWPNDQSAGLSAPLGKGPYVSASAVPSPAFAEDLADISSQLINAVQKSQPDACIPELKVLHEQAQKAEQAKHTDSAIRLYVKIINRLFAELSPNRH